MYKIHLNLDELTLSLLFFMGFDNKFKINLFLEHFLRLWDNVAVFLSLLFFSRIGMYVLMEKQYMAKFALVFYGFLIFGNTFTTFFMLSNLSVVRAYFTVLEQFFV